MDVGLRTRLRGHRNILLVLFVCSLTVYTHTLGRTAASVAILSDCEEKDSYEGRDHPLIDNISPERALHKDEPIPIEQSPPKPSVKEERARRTAVVWMTLGVVTPCEAARLRHLVETSGGMDVWVMYNHFKLGKKKYEKSDRSRELIESIPRLQKWPQSEVKFTKFDGSSGASKSSFLRFLVEHPEYDYAWHVENDMFFTGPWEEIFQQEMLLDNRTDFLTTAVNQQENQDWYHLQGCKLFNKKCSNTESTQVRWMLSRVSSSLAKSLTRDLFNGNVNGHHEAVTAPYCHTKGYSLGLIDQSNMSAGQIRAGHTGMKTEDVKMAKHTVASFHPKRGTLIHPLKCDAYEAADVTMKSDIKRWATADGWASARVEVHNGGPEVKVDTGLNASYAHTE